MVGPDGVTVAVPVRACDVGGWTDTWFAAAGRVCSLALEPGVVVRAEVTGAGIHFDLPDAGEHFPAGEAPDRHRLLVEAVAEAAPPPDLGVRLTISAAVPPGTSLGTSASVCVGIVAAVDALTRGRPRPPTELAVAALRVEVDRLGRQSGVQDQLAAAHGGINRIDVEHPSATVTPLPVDSAVRSALDEQLLHVAYGGPHDSSAVHEQVIATLESAGGQAEPLRYLADLAGTAADSLTAGDLVTWGRVLTEATDTQRALHPALLSADAEELIALASAAGALGWKVNGAAGASGSLSVLCPDVDVRRRVVADARRLGHQPLDLRLTGRGAHVVAEG